MPFLMMLSRTVWVGAVSCSPLHLPREVAMKKLILALTSLSLLAGSATAYAAPCRDSKGKFVKCPTKPAKPKVCRDSKGHYAKCK